MISMMQLPVLSVASSVITTGVDYARRCTRVTFAPFTTGCEKVEAEELLDQVMDLERQLVVLDGNALYWQDTTGFVAFLAGLRAFGLVQIECDLSVAPSVEVLRRVNWVMADLLAPGDRSAFSSFVRLTETTDPDLATVMFHFSCAQAEDIPDVVGKAIGAGISAERIWADVPQVEDRGSYEDMIATSAPGVRLSAPRFRR